jgi:FAD/FMN-containing dehydrogenase
MTASQIVDDATVEQLRFNFRGELIRPGDADYEHARLVSNGMFDRRPAMIMRCTGTADVVAAVTFTREKNLPLAVRGGGHAVAGYGTCDDGIVIDLSRMRGVRVDPAAATVRAQGGATWGDVDRETQVFGLATPGGVVSTTGIAGLTLGGGFGILSLKHGLSCDNLISADVVTADGRVLVASENENEDLFWGLRGGGGNFGIVTSFEYRLHPVREMHVALILHDPANALDLLRFYRDQVMSAPADLALMAVFMTVPQEPPMPIFPPEILGKKVVGFLAAWPGAAEEAEKAFQPLRTFGEPAFELVLPLPYTMLQQIQDEDSPFGTRWYWKSAYMKELPNEVLETLAARAPTAPSPRASVLIIRLGGAIADVPDDATAFPLRDAGFIVQMDSTWEDAAGDEESISWTRGLHEAVAPHAMERTYVNFIGDEGSNRVASAYGPEKYARLVALKQKYDPENLFRINQNIPPA